MSNIRRPTARTYNYPFPVGGINARDAITDMKPEDAISLVNVFPEAGYGIVRKGYARHATTTMAAVRSLMVWHGDDDFIFAGAGDTIWGVTNSGAGTADVTGQTNVDYQWTNIQTAGGQFLLCVNGADKMNAYDGSAWSVPVITVADSADFTNICQFKERLWFAKRDSLDLYYLGLQSIAGAATLYPLGSVVSKGGYVVGLGTFSRDAGDGPDDFFVIVTNNGEVVMYQGTDPNSITTWSLVGVFNCGKPIGRRSMVRLNGDLGIITQDGIVSAQALLQFDRASIQKASITGKIQTLFSQYAQNYFGNFGWQPCVYPTSRYLIINIPTVTDQVQTQLVMNTVTGQWGQFTGLYGGCWVTAGNNLYFGGNDGVVYQADNGYQDDGNAIPFDVQSSWQMVNGATNKFWKMVKPTMLIGGGVSYAVGVDVDFKINPLVADNSNPSPTMGMVWPWTWPGRWGGQKQLDSSWRTVGAIGTWSSIHMSGTVNGGGCQINSFETVYERGGPL